MQVWIVSAEIWIEEEIEGEGRPTDVEREVCPGPAEGRVAKEEVPLSRWKQSVAVSEGCRG